MSNPNNLRDQITLNLVGADVGERFLPANRIGSLLSSEHITTYLEEASEDLVKFIANDARKVFGTVLRSCNQRGRNLVPVMKAFWKAKFTDAELPVDELTDKNCTMAGAPECSHRLIL